MPRQFEKPDVAGGPFRLGEWLVEPSLNRVSRGGTTIQLELKVMDVLVCLAERAGEVVTRFEIIDRVWATEFIADNTLTHAVNEIRTALGDDARNPSFIETIHRRGYRLIVPVELEEPPTGTVAQFPSQARLVTDEDLSPYPGLAAFTEARCRVLLRPRGRGLADVAQAHSAAAAGGDRAIWSREEFVPAGGGYPGEAGGLGHPHLPARRGAVRGVGEGIGTGVPGDIDARRSFRDPRRKSGDGDGSTRWRERHDQALLIVDQFEELFTLNTPDSPGAVCLADSDRCPRGGRRTSCWRCGMIFLSVPRPSRDSPVLDDLTLFALAQPDSDSLHRALVEPARKLGVAFEDEKLPGEMIAEVEDERGALPHAGVCGRAPVGQAGTARSGC